MVPIRIVPLAPVNEDLVRTVAGPVGSVFRTEVTVEPPLRSAMERTYDLSRGQYNSTDLIRVLLDRYPAGPEKVLGVAGADLFVPVLTYVFGEAQLSGTAAVMSVYRLDDALYGLEADPVKLFERTLKECVHELGHTFGLLHCRDYDCAMHASTTVDDIDLKGAGLCTSCLQQIGAL